MLGCLKMTTDDALRVYTNFSKTVFEKPKRSAKLKFGAEGGLKTRYSAKNFKNTIQNVIEASSAKGANGEVLSAESLFRDVDSASCKTLVVVTTNVGPRNEVFTSYPNPRLETQPANLGIWQAAR